MKKTILVLITFALVIAVAGSGFWLVHYFIDSREQRQTYENLAEEFVLESTPGFNSTTPAESSSPIENSSEPAETVSLTTALPRHDLAALAAENPDCVGWLTIPDTGIDYPVMHTPDTRSIICAGTSTAIPPAEGHPSWTDATWQKQKIRTLSSTATT